MTAISSPLSDEARKITGQALQGALVDLLDLSLSAKQAHWNLRGPHFRSLHLQLDEIVSLARAGADTVAERAIAIGVNPDGRAATVSTSAPSPQLPSGYLADHDVVSAFTEILGAMGNRFRERIDATEKSDPVTENILQDLTAQLEKQHWMIQAQQ